MNETHKMHARLAYKCGICDTEHDSIAERAACEMACLKKKEEEAKKAAEAKKQAEKKVREAEVTHAIDVAYDLMDKFIADYGTYTYKNNDVQFDLLQNARIKHNLDDYIFNKLLGKFIY